MPSMGLPTLTAVAGGRAGEILAGVDDRQGGRHALAISAEKPGEQDAWEDWTDVPGSDANTTSIG